MSRAPFTGIRFQPAVSREPFGGRRIGNETFYPTREEIEAARAAYEAQRKKPMRARKAKP